MKQFFEFPFDSRQASHRLRARQRNGDPVVSVPRVRDDGQILMRLGLLSVLQRTVDREIKPNVPSNGSVTRISPGGEGSKKCSASNRSMKTVD